MIGLYYRIRLYVKENVDLTGEHGPLVRQQLEYRIKGRQQVNIAIEDAEKEYYIVNSKDFCHIILIPF